MRTLGKFAITWVRQMPLSINFKAVPVWVWIVVCGAYAAIVMLLIRLRKGAGPVSLTIEQR
jgi:hypothetical protein